MPGIAGVAQRGRKQLVEGMLARMAHRRHSRRAVLELEQATIGAIWTDNRPAQLSPVNADEKWVRDRIAPGPFAEARIGPDGLMTLTRDRLGVSPLYHGRTENGALCFASEVKALRKACRKVRELPAGAAVRGAKVLSARNPVVRRQPLESSPDELAGELRRRLEAAVRGRISGPTTGAWLSGGLDSSAMVALARPHVRTLHTFAAGLAGAPDLKFAREAAEFVGTEHHEVVLDVRALVAALPNVIRSLESFDALLVRSSVMNYLASQAAADYVGEVFSGEGGDELFAGYEYLKKLPRESLDDELIRITNALPNTALQRVSRCSGAAGLAAHVCFLDSEVVDLAVRIPARFKIVAGEEKWILRRAMAGLLPESVLHRPKAKFWQGAGVEDVLAEHAGNIISDADFAAERTLPNGWTLAGKEELMYYRLFREHVGQFDDLDWMGRTPQK